MVTRNQDRKFTSIRLNTTDSTQNQALKLFNKAGCGNYIITANVQRNARGRSGNTWITGKNNMCFTMLISSDLTLINRMHLSFALSIALYHFVRSKVLDNAEVRIKWPNDILINGKKVAGILIETGMKAQNRNLSYLNIGIGINIETYPTIQGREITALNQHSNVINTPGDLVENLKQTILFWLDEVKLYQWEELKSLWVSYAYNFRKEITTTYQGTKITGIFEDLEYDGALLMRLASGKCIRIDNSELL